MFHVIFLFHNTHVVLCGIRLMQGLLIGNTYFQSNVKICFIILKFPTEELVEEVENSIAEFKRQNQEYDLERVKDQVRLFCAERVVNNLPRKSEKELYELLFILVTSLKNCR